MLLHHARRPRAGDLSGFYIVRTSNIGLQQLGLWVGLALASSGVIHLATGARTYHLPGTNPPEELNVLLRD